MTTHVPARPLWRCAGCGAKWPCNARREALLADYQSKPAALALLMTGYFLGAMQDLPDWTESVVRQRFLGWINVNRQR